MLHLLITTEDFAVDFGGCLRCGEQTACCLGTVIYVFQLKTTRAEVQSCFVRTS
jgi:hypothetical protein